MKTQQIKPSRREQAVHVPQIQVRSNLRSGGDLETCQLNVEKWKERYDYWYDVARKQGKIS